jgi:hypothetical protein
MELIFPKRPHLAFPYRCYGQDNLISHSYFQYHSTPDAVRITNMFITPRLCKMMSRVVG